MEALLVQVYQPVDMKGCGKAAGFGRGIMRLSTLGAAEGIITPPGQLEQALLAVDVVAWQLPGVTEDVQAEWAYNFFPQRPQECP